MHDEYVALKTMLLDAGRLYPEERLALVSLLGRVERLEQVNEAAEKLIAASGKTVRP